MVVSAPNLVGSPRSLVYLKLPLQAGGAVISICKMRFYNGFFYRSIKDGFTFSTVSSVSTTETGIAASTFGPSVATQTYLPSPPYSYLGSVS